MSRAIFIGIHVLGVIGLVAGVVAFIRNRRDASSTSLSLAVWRGALLVGVVLAFLSAFLWYPLDADHRIQGAPFVATAWEKHGEHWEDFVGPLTLPAYVLNAVFAFLLPHGVAPGRTGPIHDASC